MKFDAMLYARKFAMPQARRSPMRYRHGGLLVYRNKVLAVAYNRPLRTADKSIHVEEALLDKIPEGYDPKDLTLIVIRVNGFDELRNSKPCSRCERKIKKFGIGQVWHS